MVQLEELVEASGMSATPAVSETAESLRRGA